MAEGTQSTTFWVCGGPTWGIQASQVSVLDVRTEMCGGLGLSLFSLDIIMSILDSRV